jgi:single-stranded DNA-binding protein
MQVKAQFTGNVTNEPELKTVGTKNTPLKELNIAVNHDKKNRDTGEYERTGDTTWITVKLWGEAANQIIGKGDLVEFDGTIVEKHFQRKDGTEGRRLESDYVAALTVKYSKSAPSEAEPF